MTALEDARADVDFAGEMVVEPFSSAEALGLAQARASLAIAEELHTANLLALAEATPRSPRRDALLDAAADRLDAMRHVP